MPFFEDVGIGLRAEEFNDIDQIFLRRNASDGEQVFEILVGSPNLMPTHVDTFVQPICTRHRLEVGSEHFASTTKSKIISNFLYFSKR